MNLMHCKVFYRLAMTFWKNFTCLVVCEKGVNKIMPLKCMWLQKRPYEKQESIPIMLCGCVCIVGKGWRVCACVVHEGILCH